MAKWEEAPLVEDPAATGQSWQQAPMADGQFMIGGETADMIRSGLSGVLEGVPVAGPAILGGAKRAAAGLSSLVGGPDYEQGLEQVQSGLAGNVAQHPNINMAGQIAGGVAGGLAIPGSTMATLPRAIASGGGLSVADMTARSLAETGQMPSGEQIISGGLFGAMLGAGGYQLGKLVQRPRVDPSINAKIDLLASEGVDITAGQATGSKGLLRREAQAHGMMDFIERQTSNFSKAALRKVGIDAPDGRLTRDVLDGTFDLVGQKMDEIALRNAIPGGNAVGDKILASLRQRTQDIGTNYRATIEGTPAKAVRDAEARIAKLVKKRFISGEEYALARSDFETTARKAGSPRLAETMREFRAALDEAMDQSTAAFNPKDNGLWRMARRMYGNLLVVEEASVRAGADAAGGLITPANLAAATKTIKGKRLYARGKTDFDELADAGVAVMRPMPVQANANIAEMYRALMRNTVGSTMAAAAGYNMLGPYGLMLGAAPAVAGRAMDVLHTMPVASLPQHSASMGAKVGATLGAGVASNNPFSNLLGDQQ